MHRFTAAAVTLLLSSGASLAPARAERRAHHVIHADIVSLVVTNGGSLSYEYLFNDSVALRIGYGASFVLFSEGANTAVGPLAGVVLLWGRDHHFELDLGLSLVLGHSDPPGVALGS